jgi:hypothetical protein
VLEHPFVNAAQDSSFRLAHGACASYARVISALAAFTVQRVRFDGALCAIVSCRRENKKRHARTRIPHRQFAR